jgi:16S rRNA (guanine1207-N2)-methyltransferase
VVKRKNTDIAPCELPRVLQARLRPPLAVALGSPREAADIVAALSKSSCLTGGQKCPPDETNLPITCYQMDLYQAESIELELKAQALPGRVVTAADLWDLPAEMQTIVYPAPAGGERALKLDIVEQAYHVLVPGGSLVVVSPYEKDQLFPGLLKKVFGRCHAPAAGRGLVFWAQREGERPRRRHEITFQVRQAGGPSLRFLSRPGTFSYGRFDDGARALVETMVVNPGDRVLDLGCGCGTNGVHAGLRSSPTGWTAFVDSNLRALTLAEFNARASGLERFEVVASARAQGLADRTFDVALANPPYFAQLSIAQFFVERSRPLLKPGGRLYLVTRQPDQVGPMTAAHFGPVQVVQKRGYTILCARAPA